MREFKIKLIGRFNSTDYPAACDYMIEFFTHSKKVFKEGLREGDNEQGNWLELEYEMKKLEQ